MNNFLFLITLGSLFIFVFFCFYIFRLLRYFFKGLPPGYKFYERNGKILVSNSFPYDDKEGYRTKTTALVHGWWSYNWNIMLKKIKDQGEWQIRENSKD